MVTREDSRLAGPEQRLSELAIDLPAPPSAIRHLCGSGANRESAFFDWDGIVALFFNKMRADIVSGAVFPDYELYEWAGNPKIHY
jgi:hypothetical protein